MKDGTNLKRGFWLAFLGSFLAATAAFATGLPPLPGTTVPEPSSALLFTAGIALIVISIRLIWRK